MLPPTVTRWQRDVLSIAKQAVQSFLLYYRTVQYEWVVMLVSFLLVFGVDLFLSCVCRREKRKEKTKHPQVRDDANLAFTSSQPWTLLLSSVVLHQTTNSIKLLPNKQTIGKAKQRIYPNKKVFEHRYQRVLIYNNIKVCWFVRYMTMVVHSLRHGLLIATGLASSKLMALIL